MKKVKFEWNTAKEASNLAKHGVSFYQAQQAFLDAHRVIAEDLSHSAIESRYFCFGKVNDTVMTVRFTYRHTIIRIIGAGYWRRGKKIYEKAREQKNKTID